MAEKRMFSKKITDSDAFIELSSSAQALYFHLNQGADDDGFNNQIQNAMFKAHATIDDLRVLMMKNFIIRFESGVIVIKHWRMHNTLRKDRYKETNFYEELSKLKIKENGSYSLKEGGDCQMVANGLPNGCHSIDKISIDKISIDKINIKKENIKEKKQLALQCNDDVTESNNNKEETNKDIYKDIIDYFNKKVGTKYKASSQATQKHINARLKEGFNLNDFKSVIDKRYAEWNNTDMQQYLRPETLFGTKFESYLNTPLSERAKKVEEKQKEETYEVLNMSEEEYWKQHKGEKIYE